jgi:hypothetical protein
MEIEINKFDATSVEEIKENAFIDVYFSDEDRVITLVIDNGGVSRGEGISFTIDHQSAVAIGSVLKKMGNILLSRQINSKD